MARREYLSREEMLKQTRIKMQQRSQGRKDPEEFRCPLAKDKETLEYYFKVLPPLKMGEKHKGGICETEYDDIWYYENGMHFFDRMRYECPRIHDHKECPMCKLGFDLMADNTDSDYRKRIASKYLARSYFAVNIYFLNHPKNSEGLRGKVMWYNAPRTVWDKWDQCINNDDSGDEDDPRACGVFFHPYESTYTFKLMARKKGDYNTYEESCFLPQTFGPLVKLSSGQPDDEAIERILDQRLVLPPRFSARDVNKLKELTDSILQKEGGKEDNTEEISVKEEVEEVVKETPKPKPAPRKVQEEIEEEVKKEPEEVIEEIPETKPAPAKLKEQKSDKKKLEPTPTSKVKEAPKEEANAEEAELQSLLKKLDEE